MKASIEIDVDKISREAIEVALADSFNRNGGDLIREIVRQVLDKKESRGYGGSSISMLQSAIQDAIREAALAGVTKWIEDHKEEIGSMVEASCALTLTPALVAENVMNTLAAVTVKELKPFSFGKKKAADDEDEYEQP